MRRRAFFLPLLLSAVLSAAAASSASAAASMEIGIADDGVTQRTPGLAPAVIPEWKEAGADVARVLAIWAYVAPQHDRLTAPKGFDPADPNDPQYNWAPIDQAVDLLRAQGIEPILNVTGWAPLWGTEDPSERDQRLRPDPRQFAIFAKAAAQRYAGRVDRYILWNEPNYPLWLKPQFSCRGGRCTPASPHLYRTLARAAYPAIKAADPGAQVYGPAIASAGKTGSARNDEMRPLQFLRSLGCVSARYRIDRSSSACRGFAPATLDGIAYHPHSRALNPDRGYPNADDANLADYGRLTRAIDLTQKTGGLLNDGSRTKKFSLYYDEWGYQTNPPDPFVGVSYAKQASNLQWGSFLAWRQPRVKLLIQYLWRDDPLADSGSGPKKYSGWQSGLYAFDGRRKPSRDAFPNPFWVDLPAGRRTATVWGQVRPGGQASVTVQRKGAGGAYRTLKQLTTSPQGYFAFTTPVNAKASFRFRYTSLTGKTVFSSTRTVTPRS